MTVFVSCDSKAEVISVRKRLTSPGGQVGHIADIIRPGESFEGHSYEDLLRLGDGEHELSPRAPMQRRIEGLPDHRPHCWGSLPPRRVQRHPLVIAHEPRRLQQLASPRWSSPAGRSTPPPSACAARQTAVGVEDARQAGHRRRHVLAAGAGQGRQPLALLLDEQHRPAGPQHQPVAGRRAAAGCRRPAAACRTGRRCRTGWPGPGCAAAPPGPPRSRADAGPGACCIASGKANWAPDKPSTK